MYTFAFVSAVGLVVAGLVRNLWPIVTGHDVGLSLLEERGATLPLRAMVLVVSAPLLLIGASMHQVSRSTGSVLQLWMTLPVAMGWAFVQGVVVVVAISAIG